MQVAFLLVREAVKPPPVIQVDHLVDACGDDPQKLAGLSVILASAAIALIDGRALKPEHCHAQLEVFRQANLKIIDRCNAAIASLRN